VCALAFTTFTLATTTRPHAQGGGPAGTFQATELAADYLRAAVNDVRRLEDSGALRVASSHEDRLLDGHRHERLQQYHLGLPVVGGSLVRQTADGVVTSILGQLYRGDVASARPGVSSEQAERRLRDGGVTLLFSPALKFLGMDDGGVRLVWEVSVMTDLTDARTVYLDASSGAELLALPLVKDQAAVGEGQGVLGDRKKMSTRSSGGTFYAEDFLRPPVLDTIDIRTNRARLNQIAAGQLAQSDIAVDSDNVWTDPVAVDAHTYLGWTYDYLFKRIGFRGLNNGDTPMYANINIYTPQQCVTTVPATEFGTFCTNAFWAGPPTGPGGRGMMVFGNGIPSNFFLTSSGQTVGPLAGALDIVAHELTHGVTDYTSGLEYRNESGALNESFSDMMGFAAEAYFQPRGTAAMQADYLMGEDSFKASRAGSVSGIRSAQSPTSYGHPDHYSIRYTGSQDNGGVHINSGIPNHVFYLAIEGGTNRVSGQTVTGVGFANREQIERVFFRAMTQMLPVRATFSQARAATIQSARDLYASNTAVVNAVTAAWNAVGVQ
jgi:Zn-dependent metalloprotease